MVRWSVRERLTAEGHDALEAGLASEAFDILARTAIDLVLLDLELPDSDGLPVIGRLNEASADVQVIILSQPSTIARAVEAMRMGALDYVNKPLNLDEVAIRVDRALDVSRLRREVQTLRSSQQQRRGEGRIALDGHEA